MAKLRIVKRDFRQHIDLLRTLTREQNCDLSRKRGRAVGDAILDLVVFELGFSKRKTKKEIDADRRQLGENDRLYSITNSLRLKEFCYHESNFYYDAPTYNKVAVGQHDSVVEAIIGAIYLDRGLPKAREWIYKNVINVCKVGDDKSYY